MDWLQWLVLFHVLTAIIGIGPTYFAHVLMRRNQTIGELRISLKHVKKLELFPKIGGSLAVLSGILLVIFTGYAFSEPWIIVSIALFAAIQIIVGAFVEPLVKRLNAWIASTGEDDNGAPPAEQAAVLNKANGFMYAANALGVLLFAMMALKPMF